MDTSNQLLTITVSGDDGTTEGVGIVRNGSAIEVYSGELPPGPGTQLNCGTSPTVTTVDDVSVIKDYNPELAFELTLSLAGGGFAPGFTAEGSGASEVEFGAWGMENDDRLTLVAGEGNDEIRVGEFQNSVGVNLNPSSESAAPDSDLYISDDPQLEVFADGRSPAVGGNDVFSATGATSEFSGPYPGDGLSVYGGPGNDRLAVADLRSGIVIFNYQTLLVGGPGDDELLGDLQEFFMPGPGNDVVAGTPPSGPFPFFNGNIVSYADSPSGVVVSLSASGAQDTVGAGVDVLSGIDTVLGSPHADVLIGPDRSGQLWGDPPGAGGDDVLIQAGSLDIMDGGGGTDVASYQYSSGPVQVDLSDQGQPVFFNRPANIEGVIGSPFDDVITGNNDANPIIGLAGRDSITGRGGADYVDVVDGERDDVACGEPTPGDVVFADSRSLDLIGPDCEEVSLASPVPPDTKPPKTTISEKPRKRSRKRKVRFEFRSSDEGSVFECRIDAEPFTPCTTPSLFRLDRGSHRLLVRAKDPAGNVDPSPASFRFTLR